MIGTSANCYQHGQSVHVATQRCNACGQKLAASTTATVHAVSSPTVVTFTWACNLPIDPVPAEPELTERELLLERARVAYRAFLQFHRPAVWRRCLVPPQAPRARLDPPARRRARHESLGLRNYAPRRNP